MRFTALICLFLFLAAPAAADVVADIPVVDNPREAPRRVTVEYEEVWRAGADESEEFIFGVISKAITDDHGNIYLLDTQQQQVFKFSATGEYMGLVSRRGEGPGEINLVYRMLYPGEGRLAFVKGFPAGVVMVDTTGTPLEGLEFHLDPVEGKETNYAMINELYWYGEHLAGSFQIMHGDGVVQSATNIFSRMDLDGNELHRFAHWPGGYDFTRPIHVVEEEKYHPFDSYTMDEQGRVYHTLEREEYLIQVVEPDGTPLFRIHRDWEVHRRTDEEKDAAKNNFRFGGNTKLPPISYDMADTDEAISNIEVVNGELLVWSPRPDRSENPDGPGYVAVFDLEGRLVEERHRNVPRDPEEDRILWLGDGRVVLVKAFYSAHAASTANLSRQVGDHVVQGDEHDDEAVLEVVVYRPVRKD